MRQQCVERFIGIKGAILDSHVDAQKILVNHATGTDVEMTDLRVSHDTLWQAYVFSGADEPGGGVFFF